MYSILFRLLGRQLGNHAEKFSLLPSFAYDGNELHRVPKIQGV
jgi:hypothetical protein